MGMGCSQCAMCKCVFSTAAAPLVALPVTQAMAQTGFMASILNNKPFVNIPPMGLCASPDHPVMKAAKRPGPCLPVMTTPWLPGAPTVMTTQGPLLNNLSKAICQYKGVVNIVTPGSPGIMTTP
jgi:hypothetical protein